jgi:hypothetical protein
MKSMEEYKETVTYQLWLRYLMFENTNKRPKDDKGNPLPWRLEKKLDGKDSAAASANAIITGADIFCLIGIVKFIFDNQDTVVISEINHANKRVEKLLSIRTTLNFFLNHYLYRKDKEELINTLKRLRTYQVEYNFYQKETGKFSSRSEHYLRTCDIEDEYVTFTISDAFFSIIEEDGWTVNYSRLGKLSGIAQALYMYFIQNSGEEFRQDFIEQRLQLVEEGYRNRDAIKKALGQLMTIGYLDSFITLKKGKKDYNFIIERKVV